MQKFDAVVVGGGPGGYECAIRLSQNGLKAALVEEAELGGTCLNRGCIPTKTLLHSADIYHDAKNGAPFGVNAGELTFDYARIIERKNAVAKQLSNGVAFLVECLLLFLVFCVVACLEFYTPLAIGHSFAQHKMLLSVAFFFAIQVVTQIVSGMLLFAGVPMLDSMDGWLNSLTPATAIHGFMWGSILISAIYGAILYCITIRMLHRHLNLE